MAKGFRLRRLPPRLCLALVLAAVTFAAVALTVGDCGVTYDEPTYFRSAWRMRDWVLGAIRARSLAEVRRWFSPAVLEQGWLVHCIDNLHPPGVPYLYNLSRLFATHGRPDIRPPRRGMAALAAVTVAVLFLAVSRQWGRAAGTTAAVALLTMPRVFGHMHIAGTDFPLTAAWTCCALAWPKAADSRPWAVALAFLLGGAFLVKFTAVGLLAPMGLYTFLYHHRRWLRYTLAVIGGVAVFVALDVPIWPNPVAGLATYVRQSLTRAREIPISVGYQGTRYAYALPWHNGFVLTAITVPVVTLGLSLVGTAAVAVGRLRDRFGVLCLLNVAAFLILRAVPSPHHNGVRLFLPMFVFVAALAGLGVAWLARTLGRTVAAKGGLAAALVLAVVISGGRQVARIHPFELSYYNELIGGLPGAHRRGYDVTYWWDAVTPDCQRRLNEHLPLGARVRVFSNAPLDFDRATFGILRPDIAFVRQPPYDDALVLARVDSNRYMERRLLAGDFGPPVYEQTKDGVPLVRLYRYHLRSSHPASRRARRNAVP